MAAKYGKEDVAELLLERGANPNTAGKVCILTLTLILFILLFILNLIINVSELFECYNTNLQCFKSVFLVCIRQDKKNYLI